ncbi:helix-hairpin-helix domain-containing protein [Streptomyces sp. BE147]|uniref:DNA polymerase Y family protein n=1 Tax=unclassified Streptomyces TaxID=2593676 RepID=UPI002E79F016|nr:helix-hairpin-helix domain-containing protein [Streptomyces sp. BE147]MEE1740932.1 helix-hairpin-helix domain-containing protein [Streptomyces sp. BE147]
MNGRATILFLRFRRIGGGPVGGAGYEGLLALLGAFTPVVEAAPPDGALADVSGALRYFGQDAVDLASVIRVRALALHGVDCAIGAAGNPMLARMAARQAAPGTTFVVPDGQEAAFLAPRPAAALDGVGAATARTLCGYGLDSVGRIAAASPATLQRITGVRTGREVWERANGIDRTRVVPNAAARSIAAERSFPRDELDRERHRRALLSLTEELGARLRGEGQVCRGLAVSVRYADRKGYATLTRSRTLREPTAHSAALTELAYRIQDSLGLQRARVRVIGLRAEGLGDAERAARQLSFDPADERARRIEEVSDRLRARFGPQAVKPGRLAA